MADETPVLVFYIENTQPYNVIDITEVTIPFYVEITDLAHDSDLIEIEDLPIPAVACYIENSKVFNITMDSSGRDGKDGLPGKDGIGLPGKDGTSITFESLTPEQLALLLKPATDAAADLYETITQLQLQINNNVFNNWFFLDLEGNVGTNYNLYSTKGVSAYGIGDDGGGGGTGGVGALSELSDTSVASRVSGDILVYNGTHWENRPQSSIVTPSLDLGETSSTAYRGDRGKIAYDHSQVTGNPHNTTFAQLESKPNTLDGYGITDAVTSTVFDNHKNNTNDEKHLTQAQLTNLINLSNWWKVDASGNLYTEKNLYSTKGVSAFGLGEDGGSSDGSVDMLDSWANYTEAKADYYAPASLLIPFRNDTLSRLTSLESGSATSITTTGSGNAVTGVSKSGNTLTFAKGSTFALSTHNHDTIYKPIGYVPSWSEITDKPSTFAPSAHTHTIANVTGLQTALDSKEPLFTKNTAFNKNFGTVEGTVMQGNDSRIHSHSNKPILDQITQSNIDVLEKLSVDNDGNIKVDTTLWATGGISAFGLGEGEGSGGGGVDMLDSWANYTSAKANYYVPASLLVPFRNDALSRLTSLESGSATSIVTTGSGNAITSLTKSGTVITANKGSTFALSSHTHTFASLTNKPTTLAGYGITDATPLSSFNAHNNDNIRHIAAQERNNWNLAYSQRHTHPNKAIIDQLTQSNIDVLNFLSVVDGNIKVDTTLWATGGISALGLGDGGGSGGGVDMLDSWANYTTAKANYYVPASLLVPFRSNTLSRLTSLENGSATSIVTTGSGNAITSLTKSGSVITANKGLTFALSSHTHTIAQITGLQGALDLKATQSDIDTAIDNLEIGGRNYFRHLFTDSYQNNSVQPVDGWYVADTGNYGGITFSTAYLEEGSTYTISFEYKTTDNSGWYSIGVPRGGGGGKYNSNKTLNLIQDGEVHKKILQITATVTEEVSIRLLRAQATGTVYYKENSLKVEKGTIPTDWSPAPEDQVSDWNITDVNSFSFIKNKPTTLGGYGITDAVTLNTTQTISGEKTFSGTVTAPTFSGALSGNASTATTATNLSRSISAGNGLTGGGTLTANRTITLGTPSTLTASTTNEVTTNSHTHSITTTTTGAANTIVQTDSWGSIEVYKLYASALYATTEIEVDDLIQSDRVHTNTLYVDTDIIANDFIQSNGAIHALYEMQSPVYKLGNGWDIRASGTEIQFFYNGVKKGGFSTDGFYSTGEITAFN